MNALTELFSNSVAQRIGWSLIHFLWQGAAVALVLAVMLALLRHRSAQLRWALSCAALALMSLLPVGTAWVVRVDALAQPAPAPAPIAADPIPAPPLVAAVELPAEPASPPPAEFVLDLEPAEAASPPVAPAATAHLQPTPAVAWPRRLHGVVEPALPWAILAWFSGVVLMSTWHLGGWLQVRRMGRLGTRPAGAAVQGLFSRLLRRLDVGRGVRLLESARAPVPVVIGWLRPVILLPIGAVTGLTPGQVEAILAHELAHIRRWDCLVQVLQAAMETLLFYHPAVWWVSRQIRQESEACCDEAAVGLSGDRTGYAHALAKVAELGAARRPAFAAAATGGKLLPRIRRLLADDRPAALSFGRGLSGALALAAILAIGMAVALSFPSQSMPLDEVADLASTQPAGAVRAAPDALTCPLSATVFEVRLPPEKAGRLDAGALAAAATPADLAKALAEVGRAAVLYRLDESIKLSGDRLMIGSSSPSTAASRLTDTGQTVNTVQYQDVGVILTASGRPAPGGQLTAELGLEISASTDSAVKIGPSASAPVIRKAIMVHRGLVTPGRPVVMISVDAVSPDAEGKAIAFVARVVLGAPHAGPPAPAEGYTCPLAATIYEVHLPSESALGLDAAGLARAAGNPADLQKTLATLGEAKVLYRVDESVRLSGDRIQIGSRVPMVVGTGRTGPGGAAGTVQYQSVGAILKVAGQPAPDGDITAKLELEISALTESAVEISPNTPARVRRKVEMAHNGPVTPGRPVVLVSADAGSPDAKGRAVAYIARIVLGAPQAAPPAAAGRFSCPLAATIYEVALPPESAAGLDPAGVARAAGDPADLQKALAALGEAKVLYRMDQSVLLSSDRIQVGSRVPMVVATRRTETGASVNAVRYESVGALLKVAGQPAPGGGISARVELEISALTESAVEIGPKTPASVVRKVVMAHDGPVKPGRPIVLVSVDAGSPDAKGNAVAYVARIVLGEPQPAADVPAQTRPALPGRDGRASSRVPSVPPIEIRRPATQPAASIRIEYHAWLKDISLGDGVLRYTWATLKPGMRPAKSPDAYDWRRATRTLTPRELGLFAAWVKAHDVFALPAHLEMLSPEPQATPSWLRVWQGDAAYEVNLAPRVVPEKLASAIAALESLCQELCVRRAPRPPARPDSPPATQAASGPRIDIHAS